MKKEYLERIYAGWLAKIIGIRYGAPVEGWTYEKIKNIYGELTDYPVDHDGEDRDTLANAVFNPDKKLLDVLAAGLKLSSENRIEVDKRIIQAARLPESAAFIGMCGRDDLKKIILDYYLGKQV